MDDENNPKSIEERFFNYRNFEELEDYEIIGDEYISVGVPKAASNKLKLHILAAIKADRLGSKSVDRIYKEYIDDWDLITSPNSWEKLLSEIYECVRHEVGKMLTKLQNIDKINTIGLIVARSALFRLQNSFKSVLLLVRKGHCIEAMCISRLILEQIAWAYNVYALDENEIIKTKPTESISRLKKFYPTAGMFYGDLSSNAHISPNLTPNYIKVQKESIRVTLNSPRYMIQSLSDILVLSDMYCCVSECIFKDYFEEFLFITFGDTICISSDREFKKKIERFDIRLDEELKLMITRNKTK